MDIKTETSGDITILRLKGELEHESGETLEKTVNQLLDSGKSRIIMEFGDINYVNSAGLRVLVQVWKDASKRKASMRFCNLSVFVQKMFRITNLNAIFTIHSTESDAIAAFKS